MAHSSIRSTAAQRGPRSTPAAAHSRGALAWALAGPLALGLAGCGPLAGTLAPAADGAAPPAATVLVALTTDQRLLQFDAREPATLQRSRRLEGAAPAGSIAAVAQGTAVLALQPDGRVLQRPARMEGPARAEAAAAPLPMPTPKDATKTSCHAALAWQPLRREWRVLVAGRHARLDESGARLIDGDAGQPGLQVDAPLRYAPGDRHYGRTPQLATLAHAVVAAAGVGEGGARDSGVGGAGAGPAATGPSPAEAAPARAAARREVVTYAIDAGTGSLVTLGGGPGAALSDAPQGGRLHTVGPLGTAPWHCARLVITQGADGRPLAHAALQGERTDLYRIDLATGAATWIGSVGDGRMALLGLWPAAQGLPSP